MRALGTIAPRGIAFVASQDRFYFSAVDPTRLYATDVKGSVLPPLEIVHKNDPSDISQWEGLGYVPPDSAMFPDTIIGITIHSGLIGHIQIIGLDGEVQREIVFPEGSPLFDYLAGVAYKAPDRLLVTPASAGVIYEITFDGNIVGEAHPVAGARGPFEGLTTIEDGRVVAAEYSSGRLNVLDSTFGRRPGDDRDFVVGLGITANKLAWNPDTGEFLVSTFASNAPVFAVSPDLSESRLVFDLANTKFALSPVLGLEYLAGKNEVAISTIGTGIRGIAFFDTTTGAFVPPRLALDPPFPVPRDVTALPAICPDCLGVRVIGRNPSTGGRRTEIRVVTPTGGTPHPTDRDAIVPRELPPIVLSCEPTDVGLAFHSSPAGDRIVVGVSFYDLAGTFVERIDKAALGVSFVSAVASITSGTHQGLFAVIEAQTSELVVFSKTSTRIDCPLP